MTTFLLGLLSASVSVSLLLSALMALKRPLLIRYRANALWLVGLMLVLLLLCPWRPSMLPKQVVPDAVTAPVRVEAMAEQRVQAAEVTAVTAAAPVVGEPSAAPVVQPVARRIDVRWDALLFGLWLAGALISLGAKAVQHARFSRLHRRWRQPLSGSARAVLTNECADLNMRMPPAWRMPMITSPMVVGLFRPALCMPDAGISDDQLALMLRHELLHIRRGDLFGVALIELMLCAHWFNPLLLWARRQMSALCELACDEAVLRDCDEGKRTLYLRAMLAALPGPRRLPLSTRFDGGLKNMKYRMGRLFDMKPRKAGVVVVVCVLLLALLTGNVLAVAGTETAEERPPVESFGRLEDRMTDEEYGYVMGLRLPDYEQMSMTAWREFLMPELVRLDNLFVQRSAENDFMYMLQWDLDDLAHKNRKTQIGDWVLVPTRQVDGPDMYRTLGYQIYLKCLEPEQVTVGRRNEVVRQIQKKVKMGFMQRAHSRHTEPDLREGMRMVMDELQTELTDEQLDVLLVITSLEDEEQEVYDDMPQAELDELIAMVPTDYLNMSISQFNALVEANLPRVEEIHQEHYTSHWTANSIRTSMAELTGEPYLCTINWSETVHFCYQLDWTVTEPDLITVGERDTRIDAVTERIWAELSGNIDETWTPEARIEYMAEVCERICQEVSGVVMTVSVSDVRFEAAKV